jgi:hypothetical protein
MMSIEKMIIVKESKIIKKHNKMIQAPTKRQMVGFHIWDLNK